MAVGLIVLVGFACQDQRRPSMPTSTLTPSSGTGVTAATPSPSIPLPTTPAGPREITVAFVGDVMLDRDVEQTMATQGMSYPLARTEELFAGADLIVGNLEGPLTDVGAPMNKHFVFATDPALSPALRPLWAVSLANNHATDYGLPGLERTIEALDEQRIAWFGAGRSETEARAPLIADHNGLRIAYLGFSDVGETTYASGEVGGVSRAGLDVVREDVSGARADPEVDFVVVTLHAGTEYDHSPTQRQQQLARAAVDAGADLVIGHHPHVLQPIEKYKGGLILYSVGNFVFDLDEDDREVLGEGPFQSVVAHVTFRAGEPLSLELRPARIDTVENRPRSATDQEAAAILRLLQPLN